MSWAKAIDFTLKWEGGYVNNPADKGGPTNRGITLAVFQAANKSGLINCPDIKALTKAEAMTIYKARYWEPYGWGNFREPIDEIMFDCTVNSGIGNAAKIAQRACVSLGRNITIDGKYGPQTRAALNYLAAWNGLALAQMLLIKRVNFIYAIVDSRPNQQQFLRGWLNRVQALAKDCGIRL